MTKMVRKKIKEEVKEQPHIHILKRTVIIPRWLMYGVGLFIILAILFLYSALQNTTDIPDYMTTNNTPVAVTHSKEITMPTFDWNIIILGALIIGFVTMLAVSNRRNRMQHIIMFAITMAIAGIVYYYSQQPTIVPQVP